METFDVSLNQVTFEEKDVDLKQEIHSFSFDSEFENDSGTPIELERSVDAPDPEPASTNHSIQQPVTGHYLTSMLAPVGSAEPGLAFTSLQEENIETEEDLLTQSASRRAFSEAALALRLQTTTLASQEAVANAIEEASQRLASGDVKMASADEVAKVVALTQAKVKEITGETGIVAGGPDVAECDDGALYSGTAHDSNLDNGSDAVPSLSLEHSTPHKEGSEHLRTPPSIEASQSHPQKKSLELFRVPQDMVSTTVEKKSYLPASRQTKSAINKGSPVKRTLLSNSRQTAHAVSKQQQATVVTHAAPSEGRVLNGHDEEESIRSASPGITNEPSNHISPNETETSRGRVIEGEQDDVAYYKMQLNKLLRDKANLEGRLEVVEQDAKESLKERARMNSQVASLKQKLKSQRANQEGLVGDRDALTADIQTLKLNRSRLEAVIVDAQKLIQDKDQELLTLKEDLDIARNNKNDGEDKLLQVKRELEAKSSTIIDLKKKVAELYVDFQNAQQSKVLSEGEVGSQRRELKSLQESKEWYQQQLQQAAERRAKLQEDMARHQQDLVAKTTYIEKLKVENVRARQQVAELQQRSLQEKHVLARQLETIERDMLERDAAFVQLKEERANFEEMLKKKLNEPVAVNMDEASDEIKAEFLKRQNELKRCQAAVSVLDHEKAELVKRLTLAQESILERDRVVEGLESKVVDLEVTFRNSQLAEEQANVEMSNAKSEQHRLEVELKSLKEEQKVYDNVISDMKANLSKVDKSFRGMQSELAKRTSELELAKTEQKRLEFERDQATLDAATLAKSTSSEKEAQANAKVIAELKTKEQGLLKKVSELETDLDEGRSILVQLGEQRDALSQEVNIGKEYALELRGQLNESQIELRKIVADLEHKEAEQEHLIGSIKAKDEQLRNALDQNEQEKASYDLEMKQMRERISQMSEYLKEFENVVGPELQRNAVEPYQQIIQQLKDDISNKVIEVQQMDLHHKQQIEDLKACISTEKDNAAATVLLDARIQELQAELRATATASADLESSIKVLKDNHSKELRDMSSDHQRQLRDVTKQYDDELRAAQVDGDAYRLMTDNMQVLQMDLERERGKLAGLQKAHKQLKEHAEALEEELASRETSEADKQDNMKNELAKKDKVLSEMADKVEELNKSLETERDAFKDIRKQMLKEKGAHVKVRREAEGLRTRTTQQQQDLENLQEEMKGHKSHVDKLYVAEIEALQQHQTALKQEMAQMKQQLDERLARDPISQEEAKTLHWQLEQKEIEFDALREQSSLADERRQVETDNLQQSLKAAQEEAAALRGELAGVKSDRVDLQRRVGELRGALKTSVDHTKIVQSAQSPPKKSLELDVTEMESIIADKKPSKPASKPLTFLQSTLSSLRGEISTLQLQVNQHTAAVQNSSSAWRELEQQVQDLREVCKTSAEERAASEALLNIADFNETN